MEKSPQNKQRFILTATKEINSGFHWSFEPSPRLANRNITGSGLGNFPVLAPIL
jgi:hypothetical protein